MQGEVQRDRELSAMTPAGRATISVMDLDALLVPVTATEPCGPDLEYDAEIQALELAVQGTPDVEIGRRADGTSIRRRGADPNWRRAVEIAASLHARTKDARIAVKLTRALVAARGLDGLAEGLELLVRLLERFGEDLHPRADHPDDVQLRANAFLAIDDPAGLLGDVREARVGSDASGPKITVRDICAAERPGDGKSAARSDGEGEFGAAVASLLRTEPDSVDAATRALDLIERLQSQLDTMFAPDSAPKLVALRSVLQAISGVSTRRAFPALELTGPALLTTVSQHPVRRGVASRAEATALLDEVCRFLEDNEPANPAPLLIRRAQRLMSLGFVEILEDLAPDSVAAFAAIAGLRRERA